MATTYQVDPAFRGLVDSVVIALRRAGFPAWAEHTLRASGECSYQIVTTASRMVVLMTAGHGQFLC